MASQRGLEDAVMQLLSGVHAAQQQAQAENAARQAQAENDLSNSTPFVFPAGLLGGALSANAGLVRGGGGSGVGRVGGGDGRLPVLCRQGCRAAVPCRSANTRSSCAHTQFRLVPVPHTTLTSGSARLPGPPPVRPQDLALALQSGYSLPMLMSSAMGGPGGPLPLTQALALPSVPSSELPKLLSLDISQQQELIKREQQQDRGGGGGGQHHAMMMLGRQGSDRGAGPSRQQADLGAGGHPQGGQGGGGAGGGGRRAVKQGGKPHQEPQSSASDGSNITAGAWLAFTAGNVQAGLAARQRQRQRVCACMCVRRR